MEVEVLGKLDVGFGVGGLNGAIERGFEDVERDLSEGDYVAGGGVVVG